MWNPSLSFQPSCSISHTIPWCNKRKLKDEISIDLVAPPKILITEEKMVSQLKSIHISKDYVSHDNNTTSSSMNDEYLLLDLQEERALPTLVVCDEIRALKSVEAVLPKHIMDKYQRPTNALVLWQPPVGDLGKYLKAIKHSEENAQSIMSRERSCATSENGDVEMNEDDDNNNNKPSNDVNGFFTRTI